MVSLARPLPVTIATPLNTERMWLLMRRWLQETGFIVVVIRIQPK